MHKLFIIFCNSFRFYVLIKLFNNITFKIKLIEKSLEKKCSLFFLFIKQTHLIANINVIKLIKY